MKTYRKATKPDYESEGPVRERVLCVWESTEEPPKWLYETECPFTIEDAEEEEYECFKGNPPLVAEYLHICKESAYDKGAELGLTDEQTQKLITALYEVKFLVDVTTGTIFAVNGKILDTAQDYEGPE